MFDACCLASVRKTIWCVIGSAILLTGTSVRADVDPVEIPDAPTPLDETEYSKLNSADETAMPGKVEASETESVAARKHLRNQPINRLKASIKPPPGELPKSHSIADLALPSDLFSVSQSRPWAFSCYQWEAPATRHLPLLFEEPNLERLGFAYGFCDIGICDEEPHRGQRLQALVSGVRFFGRIPFIPYMAGVHPLTEPVYTLGSDRPGSPVPYRKYLPHYSLRGAAYQAGAIVGAAFIIP